MALWRNLTKNAQTINPTSITTGTHHKRRFTIGGTLSLTWIVCVKYVSTLPTKKRKSFGATIRRTMEDNIEIIEDGDYKVTIDYENKTTTFELCDSENSGTTV